MIPILAFTSESFFCNSSYSSTENSTSPISFNSFSIIAISLFLFLPSSIFLLMASVNVVISTFNNESSTCLFEDSRVDFVFSNEPISFSKLVFSFVSFLFSFVNSLILSSYAEISCVSISSLNWFDTNLDLTSELNFSLAITSFSSIGKRPIHLERSLPLSASFFSISSSNVDSVTDIIKSKSLSFPITSLIALFVCAELSS